MEVVPMINRPLYVDKIMAYTDTPFAKVLTGVRRCGKSTVLKMIMEKLQQEHGVPSERIVSMRFDSMDYEDMTTKDMFKAVKEKLKPTGRTYLFLDEATTGRSRWRLHVPDPQAHLKCNKRSGCFL